MHAKRYVLVVVPGPLVFTRGWRDALEIGRHGHIVRASGFGQVGQQSPDWDPDWCSA